MIFYRLFFVAWKSNHWLGNFVSLVIFEYVVVVSLTRLNFYFPDYVTIEQGKHGPNDYVLKINGKAITYRSLANICAFLAHNEERRFPQWKGFFGKQKLIDCLVDAMEKGHVPYELLVKHQI